MNEGRPAATSPQSGPGESEGGPGRRRRRTLVLHPVLFAAFPILSLYAGNIREGIGLRDVAIPLVVVLAVTLVLFALGTLALRSAGRAGLAVSALVLLFFFYGPVYSATSDWTIAGVDVGRHAVLLPTWALAGIGGIALAARARRWVPELTAILNAVAVGLVLVNVWSVVSYEVGSRADERAALRLSEAGFEGRLPDPSHVLSGELIGPDRTGPPDIYYLVLEEYAGEQVLRNVFGFDNSPFLGALEDRGFFVAHRSTANYPRTSLSLASSLNMEYLDFLARRMGPDSDDAKPLVKLIEHNRVATFLKSLSYRYVHIGSWYGPTGDSPLADQTISYGGPSEFASALYETTVLQPLSQDDFRRREWKRVQFQLEALRATRETKGPKFVFAHLLIPHGPNVFNRDGGYVTEEQETARGRRQSYVEQVRYLNRELLGLVDRLLDRPAAERPVIILQADEGPYEGAPTGWTAKPSPSLRRKFPIFNAFFLPGKGDGGMTEEVTPVNAFRVVFNLYFGAALAVLPDRNYIFRSLKHLYDFTDVTPLVRASLRPS